jgi:hypothetical protein
VQQQAQAAKLAAMVAQTQVVEAVALLTKNTSQETVVREL